MKLGWPDPLKLICWGWDSGLLSKMSFGVLKSAELFTAGRAKSLASPYFARLLAVEGHMAFKAQLTLVFL